MAQCYIKSSSPRSCRAGVLAWRVAAVCVCDVRTVGGSGFVTSSRAVQSSSSVTSWSPMSASMNVKVPTASALTFTRRRSTSDVSSNRYNPPPPPHQCRHYLSVCSQLKKTLSRITIHPPLLPPFIFPLLSLSFLPYSSLAIS